VLAVTAAAFLARTGWYWGLAVGVTLIAARAAARLYRRRLWLSYYHEIPRALVAAAAAFGLVAALGLVLGIDGPTGSAVSATVVYFVLLAALPRAGVFQLARWARKRFGRCERAVVLGAGPLGVELARSMIDHPDFGLLPVGFVDPLPPGDTTDLPVPLLTGELHEALVRARAGAVVIAFSHATDAQVVDAAITAHRHGATILTVPRLWELYHDAAHIERLRGYPLVRLATAPTERISWWVKRSLDWLLAALALVAASPIMLGAVIAVALESGRPFLFRQERVGLDGHTFELLKFRSMRPADESESQTRWNIAGDPRIGPVGRVLRRTSIDELPQLWNILRGDMSLVGPRPERPGFVAEFSEVHDRYWARHRVPAGLTGLAQVNGLRGDTSIADRSRYDNYYIANWSLWLDLKILLLTVREIFRTGQH
jgi:exopolysaccharide biosynthesis polyprenyl glycosylphosphotransferase